MAGLASGMLVEISGLRGPAKPVPEAVGASEVDLNGRRAQLLRLDRGAAKWIALTFGGDLVAVDGKHLRPLSGQELSGKYDFVLGPKSDYETVGAELADCLSLKGYAVMRLLVGEEDVAEMLAAAARLEDDGQFSRIAVEFERGYLGKDGSAKTLLLDPSSQEAPDYIRNSPLRMMDHNFAALSQMLGNYSKDALGFKIYSRSNMMLRKPFVGDDVDKYPPADIDDGDAEGYFHLMTRKRLTLMQFVGPGAGTLTLIPQGVKAGRTAPEVKLDAEPGTVVFVLASRYDYSYQSAPYALALTSFFLADPALFDTTGEFDVDDKTMSTITIGAKPPPGEQVSVDAIHCRYGMQDGRQQYWNAFAKGAVDSVMIVPHERWDHDKYFDVNGGEEKSYTKHGCFGIEGVDLFDCKFFEVSSSEARHMDPCQRQVLEVSYLTLLEGGWDRRSLAREPQNIGHFVGIDKQDWMCMSSMGMLSSSGTSATGATASITSNRFAYAMNLKGVSMTIDTACSSSLVCTHVSKLHLRFKENEKMPASIVNGINLMLFCGPFVDLSAAGMLSHTGRSFTFNSTADGYARGECCGAACFKPMQYKNDGSVIGCLAGSQANQDGRSATLTAPSGPAQEKCINAVLRECMLTPPEVDCFECNGTGTSLGDPIEVSAFRKIMSATPRKTPLVIASSKSNIGHGEGGAGMCGLVKCFLQVSYSEVAASIHLERRNPHLDLDGFPCQLLTEGLTFREDSGYSGVSAFGFGGTNAHAEAWGSNIMTTRAARATDSFAALQRKLADAPPAEITMNGDDISNWETTGMDPRVDPDAKWSVFIGVDGVAEWEVDESSPDLGDFFSIRGSHNDWEPTEMERHCDIAGLWTGEITLGDSGEEFFQVLAEGDSSKIFHPAQRRCSLKASKIYGPERVAKEVSWVIEGRPGETFTVEFFQRGRSLSVLWLKR